jgi:hypothetical protein
MWSVSQSFKVKLGGNYYIDCGSLIDFHGSPLFTVKRREEDGLLGIDFDIYDAKNKKVATVRRGTVVDGDKEGYDISYAPHHYTVTEKNSGRIICEIKRAGQSLDAVLEVSVDMFTPSGFRLIAGPTATNIGGAYLSGNTFAKCGVGISVN